MGQGGAVHLSAAAAVREYPRRGDDALACSSILEVRQRLRLKRVVHSLDGVVYPSLPITAAVTLVLLVVQAGLACCSHSARLYVWHWVAKPPHVGTLLCGVRDAPGAPLPRSLWPQLLSL